MKWCHRLLVVGLVVSLSGCAKSGDEDDNNPYQGLSASELYQQSQQSLKKKQYTTAIKQLESLETMYPFHDNAEKAEIDLIYAYYKKEEYPQAAASAERFIHLYPRAKRVDYVYYMKALANFQQNRGTLAQLFPIDESWRSPGTQSKAYSDFATLVQQFPDSPYRSDSEQRMIYLRNLFAQHELNVASYYYERKMYVAAAERASSLVTTYPQAPSVKQALAVIYHANQKLGLPDAAADALKVYQATYHQKPQSV